MIRVTDVSPSRVRARANERIRRAAGLNHEPPPHCMDPALAYGEVDGVARVVHGDLPAMLIGGVASLLLQMLHPYAMAGVDDHSRYREDPLGRLLQTANFISATTYGSRETAAAAVEKVRRVHDHVHGVADDGVAYDAHDPHLLLWIHCAETAMFLEGYRRFGARRLTHEQCDRYVREMTTVARDLGVLEPPTNLSELRAALLSFRPELRLTPAAATARDFLSTSVVRRPGQRIAHYLIARSAWTVLPSWGRDLLEIHLGEQLQHWVVAPGTALFARTVRLAVPPPRQVAIDSPPSIATT